MMPEEAWSSNKLDVSHLRIFGSKAFVHVPDIQCSKLRAKSLICTFLGQAENWKAFQLVHQPMRRFLESRDIVFDEGTQHYQHVTFERSTASSITDTPTTSQAADASLPPNSPEASTTTDPAEAPVPAPVPAVPFRPKCQMHTPACDDDLRYSVTSYGPRKCPNKHACVAKIGTAGDPCSYMEAMAHPDAAEWELACNNEK